jgi:NitT/TauT family transport system substrate-binding protein
MRTPPTRRTFMATATAVGAAAFLGPGAALADEEPPETTTIRIGRTNAACLAPEYIAADLLRTERFTDIRYIQSQTSTYSDATTHADIDFDFATPALLAVFLDAGKPITALAGVHPGCYELFAHEPIRTINDLKGRRVGIPQAPGSAGHLQLAVMAAHVGLDPRTDIEWVADPAGDLVALFADGKVDAFLAFPPEPQELRARGLGRMILSLTTDKPWSQYFCCMACGNRAFVRAHPVATKRFLRAVLKAADLCATEPRTVARQLVDRGVTQRYDYTLQALTELPYASWREYDPEDSLRFYGLRLREVGMIKSSPNKLIAEGTDWRFLNEIKRELKA